MSARRSQRPLWPFYIGVTMLVAILLIGSVRTTIATFIHLSLARVTGIPNDVTGAVSSSLSSRTELLAENTSLKEALEKNRALALDHNQLVKENAELRAAFGRSEGVPLIVATVLSKPNRSPYDTIIIDAGRSEGVMPQNSVLAYGVTPIGTVVESYGHSSLVRLYSAPGEEIAVHVGSSSIQATAYGIGGGNFKMQLPKDTGVTEGDVITTPGEHPFVLGTIARIDESDTETLARIYFISPVNMYTLSKVYVKPTPK